jgi:hypothetical protein
MKSENVGAKKLIFLRSPMNNLCRFLRENQLLSYPSTIVTVGFFIFIFINDVICRGFIELERKWHLIYSWAKPALHTRRLYWGGRVMGGSQGGRGRGAAVGGRGS